VTASPLASLAFSNYGNFTTMLVRDGQVRAFSRHLDRLVRDCHALFQSELDTQVVRRLVRDVALDTAGQRVVRITVFDPAVTVHDSARSAHPQISVSVRNAGTLGHSVTLQSVDFVRPMPTIKHAGVGAGIYYRRMARLAGYDDALFTDPYGRIGEGPTWNIGFVFDGAVVWPDGPRLPGITMSVVSELAARSGLSVTVAALSLRDARNADAAFITNATLGVQAVSAIDDHAVPTDASVVQHLRAEYESLAGEHI
jgi:branched-subunit amino acid aminotransferase/4-amino-4-deoxychorismate lyase